MNLANILWNNKYKYDDKSFLLINKDQTTFQELVIYINHITEVLVKSDISRGDKVIIALNNRPEWLASLFAIIGVGAICVPVNPGLRSQEMCNIVLHCQPNLLIVEESLTDHFKPVKNKVTMHIFDDQSRLPLTGNHTSPPVVQMRPDETALIYYTSGTTGSPKGVVRSHAAEIEITKLMRNQMGILSDDTTIILGSLAFIYPLMLNALTSISAGASLVIPSRFHPELVTKMIQDSQVTLMMAVPTMYIMMCNFLEGGDKKLGSIRFAISAGASLPASLCERARNVLGIEIFDLWGMTECTPVTSYDPKQDNRGQADSCGRVLPGCKIKIVGDDLEEVKSGEVGEILMKTKTMMTHYYRNPEASAEAVVNGWMCSGDLGKVDADGYLYIVGRKKDLIIRGGANIYPVEVEETIYSYPSVLECAVVGAPDTVFGEVVEAYIVSNQNEIDLKELRAHCEPLIAEYKIPTRIFIVDELPKGPTGKILRRKLRET